jgi:hypothetical protein
MLLDLGPLFRSFLYTLPPDAPVDIPLALSLDPHYPLRLKDGFWKLQVYFESP